MNEHGRAQARRNGMALKAYFDARGVAPTAFAFLASPMGRACETMRLVRTELGLEPEAFERIEALKELTFGDWEGHTMKELKARDRPAVRARKADKWAFTPPGGESYQMLSRRIATWHASVERDAVVVAHGGVLRVLRGLLFGAPERHLPIRSIDQDRILVTCGGMGAWL